MTPWTFLIVATLLNLAIIWLIYPKGTDNERR